VIQQQRGPILSSRGAVVWKVELDTVSHWTQPSSRDGVRGEGQSCELRSCLRRAVAGDRSFQVVGYCTTEILVDKIFTSTWDTASHHNVRAKGERSDGTRACLCCTLRETAPTIKG
jgi:hypothetical protein